MKNRTFRIVLIPLFAALTAVGAQIAIPIGSVPITLQMLFVFFTGFMLKPYDALISMLLYLSLGAAGLPVFANFSAGIQHLAGPTAGYLWAFPLAAFLVSYFKKVNPVIAGIFGLTVVYLLGWTVLGLFIKNFAKAFMVGVLPFIAIDTVKMLIALYAWKKVDKVIGGMIDEKA